MVIVMDISLVVDLCLSKERDMVISPDARVLFMRM
jgi:hypothetical protein